MDTKGAKNRERLDLGLEAILAGGSTPQPVEVAIDLELSQAARDTSKWTLGDAPPAASPKSEFEILADERKWTEIVRVAEARFEHGDDYEAKVWWVRGHLGAFSMPVSFLSAPFDAVCRKLSPENVTGSLRTILEETGLLVLQRLREISDSTHSAEVRESLERLGIKEPRGGRERTGTSSFRSLQSVAVAIPEPSKVTEVAPPVPSGARKRITLTALCFVVVVTLMVLDQIFPNIRTPALDIASEGFEQPQTATEQAIDTLARRDPGGRLGALFYAIDEGARAAGTSPSHEVAPIPPASSQPQSASTSEPLPARSKEEVDTTGPVEGAEFRDRIERGRPRLPESRREELQGGAPQAVLSGSSSGEFDGQRTYKVISRTSVLSAPSYGGRVIGQLEAGDRVLVEGKLGRWLRLRSKKGRGGYVLTADVEEVPELDIASNR
jgi:hypothetical protein